IPTTSYGVPTASEESSHCQKKRDVTAVKIRTATKVKNNNLQGSRSYSHSFIKKDVHVSPSGSDKLKKHDDNAKREDKGKSLLLLDFSSSANLHISDISFLLTVGTFFTGSGNSITGSGNALCILFPTITVVATSSTKAEYVATASCCAQVLWIQN
nr:hypothetical protein [Tanacetum cinerariifolium]